MNQPDTLWNFGESTDAVDTGGALGPDPLAQAPQFTTLSGGWRTHPHVPGTIQYIGTFHRPGGAVAGDDSLASFELVGPPSVPEGLDLVVAIYTQSTFGPPASSSLLAPHNYPGDPNYHGLLWPNGIGAHIELVTRSLQNPSPSYRVVGVQFTPRTSARPIVFTMQRLRQVRAAALALVTAQYGVPSARVAFHVTGTSFGGLTAPLATVYYPQEFHSATGIAYSAAHRSMPSDYDGFTFLTSLLALDGSGNGYLMRDTVEIPMWAKQEQTDSASLSFTNRLFHGHVQRPVYFGWGDEDPVAQGTDWAMILRGSGTQHGEQPQHGRVPWPTVVPTQSVHVRFSVVPKTCHENDVPDAYILERADGSTEQTNDLLRMTEVMVEIAHVELGRAGVVPITDPSLGRTMTQTPLPSLDPSSIPLSHGGSRTYNPGSQPNLLVENPTFKRYGQGTWLGANESVKVVRVPGDDRDSVFVGSADGYVTRLKMVPKGTNPTIKPLVEVARSNKNNLPYALGYGTWGLAVGNVDSSPELEVVVGAYDRIAVFRAADLSWVREVRFASLVPPDRAWEYTNPRKIVIADIDGGATNEIIFRTLHNHLVIMSGDVAIVREHGEGGIIDLVAGPAPSPRANYPLKIPVYLLSARGHVARLEFDASLPPANAGVLAAASPLLYGGLRDMDLVMVGNEPCLAVLTAPHAGDSDAVRLFSVTDCDEVGSFGNIRMPPPPPEQGLPPLSVQHPTPTGDMEPSFTYVAGHPSDRWVISSGGHLSVWDGSECLGHKRPDTFAPASGHGCVEAGEIDPASAGHEVVVATTAGKVVWFTLDDLYSDLSLDGQTIQRTRTFALDGGIRYEDRCNLSLGATWAMAAEPANGTTPGLLRVIDPVGTWWEVAPDGTPSFKREIGYGVWGLVPAKASSLGLGSGGTGHRAWATDAQFGPRLWTTSYVPNYTLLNPPPPRPWWIPAGVARPFVQFEDGSWVFPATGASYDDGSGTLRCAWWNKYLGVFPNLIQQATYSVTGGMASVSGVWGSTLGPEPNNAPPPRWPRSTQGYLPLRTEGGNSAPSNAQSIAIGRVLLGQTEPQVVATCMGGRVMVLSGVDGKILWESDDFGVGGMAMALADLDGNGFDEVVFAPVYSPIAHTGGKVRSHLRVLSGNTLGGMTLLSTVPVGDPNNDDFVGYGACGIAVFDLPGSPAISKAILVTTLNGELVVFAQSNGVVDSNPVFRRVVEGSIGAYNSIVLANLDPGDPKPELYLGGSSGIRRFDLP